MPKRNRWLKPPPIPSGASRSKVIPDVSRMHICRSLRGMANENLQVDWSGGCVRSDQQLGETTGTLTIICLWTKIRLLLHRIQDLKRTAR